MSIAFWCVVVAALLPHLLRELAEIAAGATYDSRSPRESLERAGGRARRAFAAHLNGFEVFPVFAVAVVFCHLLRGPSLPVDVLAVAFLATRIAHAVSYVLDAPRARSISFALGGMCIAGMIAIAAGV